MTDVLVYIYMYFPLLIGSKIITLTTLICQYRIQVIPSAIIPWKRIMLWPLFHSWQACHSVSTTKGSIFKIARVSIPYTNRFHSIHRKECKSVVRRNISILSLANHILCRLQNHKDDILCYSPCDHVSQLCLWQWLCWLWERNTSSHYYCSTWRDNKAHQSDKQDYWYG